MTPCSGCGLVVDGGAAGCHAIFEALVGRDFSDARYGRVHRLMVDVYCLQHPDEHCASAKSLAAHLMGLGWFMTHAGTRAIGPEPLRAWLDGTPHLDKPELPPSRGLVTIADVRHASDPATYADAVERWACSTWDAYSSLQVLATRWIEQALTGQRLPRR